LGQRAEGEFLKMMRTGIEYRRMQAYGEGFDILRGAGSQTLPVNRHYQLDVTDIAQVWRHGSGVASGPSRSRGKGIGKTPSRLRTPALSMVPAKKSGGRLRCHRGGGAGRGAVGGRLRPLPVARPAKLCDEPLSAMQQIW